MANREPVTLPPRRAISLPAHRVHPEPHPLDPVIEVLSELSKAVRASSVEVQQGMTKIADSMNALGGRLDGQSRAMQEMTDEARKMTKELRSFVDDKDRLKGRVIMLEMLEHGRQEANGKSDDAE